MNSHTSTSTTTTSTATTTKQQQTTTITTTPPPPLLSSSFIIITNIYSRSRPHHHYDLLNKGAVGLATVATTDVLGAREDRPRPCQQHHLVGSKGDGCASARRSAECHAPRNDHIDGAVPAAVDVSGTSQHSLQTIL